MGFFEYFFGLSGRATRLNWWAGQAVSYAICIAAGIFMGLNLDPLQRLDLAQLTAESILGILKSMGPALAVIWLGAFIGFSVTVRRLHDRNKSGWWIYLPAAPLVILAVAGIEPWTIGVTLLLATIFSIWQLVELGCLAGTMGGNDYGPEYGRMSPHLEREIAALQRRSLLEDNTRPVFGRRPA